MISKMFDNRKLLKLISLALCAVIVLSCAFSAFYVFAYENHVCSFDCPVCARIENAKGLFGKMALLKVFAAIISLIIFLFSSIAVFALPLRKAFTPVSLYMKANC